MNLFEFAEPDGGVGKSDELVDPDEAEETEMDRALPLAEAGIEIGSECFVVGERLRSLEDIWEQ